MSDDNWARLRRMNRLDRVTTVLAVVVAAACAVMTVWAGAHGQRGEALTWLLMTGASTAMARWMPPLVTIRETGEAEGRLQPHPPVPARRAGALMPEAIMTTEGTTVSETETPADRLREAAQLVRQGWTRGAVMTPLGERCAIGAIGRVNEVRLFVGLSCDPVGEAALKALSELIPLMGREDPMQLWPSSRVIRWNDWHAKDAEEVASAMEKAAARYEETH